MIPSRMISPDPVSLLDRTRAAVLEAGAMIRAEFHRPGGPRSFGPSKAPIDTEVEAFLQEHLQALHPCTWHGEELPRRNSGHRDSWVVDPQDGTSAFLRGFRGPAVSVALVRDERPVLAIVYAPTAPDDAGDLFAWAEGLSVTRNGRVLTQLGSGPVASYGPITVVAMNEKAGDWAKVAHMAFAPAGLLAMPSIAYRLALAAAGEVDAAVSITSGLHSYDVAAGQALIEAVGGQVLQLNGRPLLHETGSYFNGCVGGRKNLVAEVIQRVRSIPQTAPTPRKPAKPKRRVASVERLSRAQGVLLGQFAGDALGAQVEFQCPMQIRIQHPRGVTELLPGGTWGLLAGQFTDDSEMALALARSLVAQGGFDAEATGRAYVAWGQSHPFDVGMTTREALKSLSGVGEPNRESQSNGALMRVSPMGVAAVSPRQAAEWAAQDARLTHPHPVCVAASAAFAAAVSAGGAGASPADMWMMAMDVAGQGT